GGEAGHGGISLVDGLPGWQTALITIAAVSLVIVAGNFLTAPLFRFIAVARLRELFTATALLIVITIALLMSLVGLSPALGTFIAGVVLANSDYRHELESDIDPFRGLLLGLFFMTVGAAIPFDLLFENAASILALTIGLMALKAGVLLVLAWLFRLRGADRWLFALGLAQAGEFGFVLISFALTTAVLPADLAARLSLIVALSMLLTPALFIAYERLIAPRFAAVQSREAEPIDQRGAVIIAGHGRFGGIVNRMMRAAGFTCTVVDYSDAQLRMLRAYGLRAYYGDATRPDLLHAAGIEEAKLFVAAIDGKEQLTALVRYVVKAHPHVHVIARAIDREHVYELWSVGCRDIIRETYDSSLRAGRSALQAMGLPCDQAQRFAAEFERVDRASMVELADLYDIETPMHQNAPYVARVREMMEEWEAQLRGQATIAPDNVSTADTHDGSGADGNEGGAGADRER
ncbi:MAG: cation:proton antiporter, partial [Azospirillaceae bacterium]